MKSQLVWMDLPFLYTLCVHSLAVVVGAVFFHLWAPIYERMKKSAESKFLLQIENSEHICSVRMYVRITRPFTHRLSIIQFIQCFVWYMLWKWSYEVKLYSHSNTYKNYYCCSGCCSFHFFSFLTFFPSFKSFSFLSFSLSFVRSFVRFFFLFESNPRESNESFDRIINMLNEYVWNFLCVCHRKENLFGKTKVVPTVYLNNLNISYRQQLHHQPNNLFLHHLYLAMVDFHHF